MKWQKQHIQTKTFSSFDQNRNAKAVFVENPELVEFTMWSSFKKLISPLVELLLQETNQYANKDKNKAQFKVTLEDVSIDESMVIHISRHSCKQFIHTKQIRFECKLWVLASATGVPYKIEIYQGRTNQGSDEPLGTRVIKNALEICKNPKDHSVYFHNFFSSYSLICYLATEEFTATDTMKNDRVMKCPLVDVKKMNKKERKSFDFWRDGNKIVRWNDNSLVTIGSNVYRVQPIRIAKRWIKGKGKKIFSDPPLLLDVIEE